MVVCWNSRQDLPACLASLERQTYPNVETVVVDNGSTDETVEYIKAEHPNVRVREMGGNVGYATANNAGFSFARGDYLIVLNPDTEVEPQFVSGLVEAVDRDGVGLATSRICFFDDRERINACGNDVHVSGLGFCRGLGQPVNRLDKPSTVPAISGCAFVIRRDVLDRIGGFDDEYFTYDEDSDLSLRAAVAGFSIAFAPRSVVYHKYALRMNAQKFYYLERNRRLTLLKNLRWGTLIALLPVTLATSALMWLYALIHGPAYLDAKWRASKWIYGNWRSIAGKHTNIQALRKVDDRRVVRLLSSALPADQVIGPGRASGLLGIPANVGYWLLAIPARIFG